jgi:hypothetical protein
LSEQKSEILHNIIFFQVELRKKKKKDQGGQQRRHGNHDVTHQCRVEEMLAVRHRLTRCWPPIYPLAHRLPPVLDVVPESHERRLTDVLDD